MKFVAAKFSSNSQAILALVSPVLSAQSKWHQLDSKVDRAETSRQFESLYVQTLSVALTLTLAVNL
eukprot:363552-Chlamydomonas_euryale.AAC.10